MTTAAPSRDIDQLFSDWEVLSAEETAELDANNGAGWDAIRDAIQAAEEARWAEEFEEFKRHQRRLPKLRTYEKNTTLPIFGKLEPTDPLPEPCGSVGAIAMGHISDATQRSLYYLMYVKEFDEPGWFFNSQWTPLMHPANGLAAFLANRRKRTENL